MNDSRVDATTKWGLLANGVSGPWSVDIDESCDGTGINMQIDCPAYYLAFELHELPVLQKLLSFLRTGPDSPESLRLGNCDGMEISIVRDNGTAGRCLIAVQGNADGSVRLTLDAGNAELLADALQQVVEELAT